MVWVAEPTVEQLKAAIRRATISLKFVPLLMGSAYKNKGVQSLLDAVIDYLPNPSQKECIALDLENKEQRTALAVRPDAPLVGLAFKLDQSRFGQLTYMRIYQGTLTKSGTIVDQTNGKRVKVPRLVRMHSNSMADVDEASAGDIVVRPVFFVAF
jgi:elongation factor G